MLRFIEQVEMVLFENYRALWSGVNIARRSEGVNKEGVEAVAPQREVQGNSIERDPRNPLSHPKGGTA